METNRTKAEFRATREMVGMTQSALAKELGVEVRSVKRWESLDAPQMAPKDAWDVLDAAKEDQDSLVDYTLDLMDRIRENMGRYPESYRLVFWSSQEQYNKHHLPHDAGDWRMANANALRVAAVLMDTGVRVEWVDRPTVRE